MRFIFTFFFLAIFTQFANSQAVYPSSKYAVIGDTERLTNATVDTVDYYATGPNHVWNFDSLKGTSQDTLTFRNPKNAGFSQIQWAYVYNTSNVNLSSTNQQTTTIGPATVTNQNDFYLNNTGGLVEKASSFTLTSGISLNIKNTFTSVDSVYRFPLHYLDTFSSAAGFTTNTAFIYYNKETLNRTNKVDGWGTVTTPYGTFKHCLRVTSNVIRYDSFAVTGYNIPVINQDYRELKWLDTSKGYPVLVVTQTNTGAGYVTSSIQFLDVKKAFPPKAQFVYRPLLPSPGDTITFYNISQNSTTYSWNFGDSTTSTATNPTHIYINAGVYTVTLIASSGGISDTFTTVITVGYKPLALFTYNPFAPTTTDTISFTNNSIKATTYSWNFGDSTTSTSANPQHIYTLPGTYTVTLIASNGNSGYDTLKVKITVTLPLPIKLISFTGNYKENANHLQWSTAKGSDEHIFEIERSLDGINFIELSKIGSNAQNNYEFTDANYDYSIAFYRLKMIDKENVVSYSPTIKILATINKDNKIVITPNPVAKNQAIKLQFVASQNETISIKIVGIDGKMVSNKTVDVTIGNNSISLLNNLNAGIYVINFIDKENAVVSTSKLVVN